MDRGQLSAAREQAELAKTFAQQPGEASVIDGFIMLFDRNYPEATERFARGVAQGAGDNPYAWWGWGRALAEQRRFDLAVAKYRKALDLYPVMAESYTDLGAALSLQDKTDEALAVFVDGEKVTSRYARFYHEWDLALDRAGRKDEAASKLAKASTLATQQGVKW